MEVVHGILLHHQRQSRDSVRQRTWKITDITWSVLSPLKVGDIFVGLNEILHKSWYFFEYDIVSNFMDIIKQ